MKRAWSTGFLLGPVLVLSSTWLLTAAAGPATGQRTVLVRYDFSQPTLERHAGEVRVAVAGCDHLTRSGKPILPFQTARILLPPGCRVLKVETHPLKPPVTMPGTWRVEYGGRFVQPVTPEGPKEVPGPGGSPRQNGAPSTSLYPAARAEMVSVQRLAGYDIVLVRVFPVQYAPGSGQLHFAEQVQISLSLTTAGGRPAGPFVRGGRERVASFVDNPTLLEEYQAGHLDEPSTAPARCDYLLVTKAALAPFFQALLERKTRDGLSVKTETMEFISTNQPGRDGAEKLRNYIRNAHTNWGVSYVLLGGDTATVPCRHAFVYMKETGADSYLPCDLYFACLDGSWNRDGDQRWGESTDGEDGGDVDLLAEVWVGRAPVDTPEETAVFVEKTVRYEEKGHRDPGQVLLAAEFLGHFSPELQAQGGNMLEPLLPYFRDGSVRWLDDRPQSAPQWNGAQAVAALNQSPHFVLSSGHGENDSLMRLRPGDLDALTNQDLFLAYSVSCHGGRFDNDAFSPDSIAEELVKRHRAGAFAAIVNARAGWFEPGQEWKYSGEYQIKFFDELLHKGQIILGQASQAAKQDMIGHLETSGIMPYRWCYYQITLFGDPHLAVRGLNEAF